MSKEIDIETLTRPGGIIPINVETTAALVRKVIQLQAAVDIARTALLTIERRCEEARAEITRAHS